MLYVTVRKSDIDLSLSLSNYKYFNIFERVYMLCMQLLCILLLYVLAAAAVTIRCKVISLKLLDYLNGILSFSRDCYIENWNGSH